MAVRPQEGERQRLVRLARCRLGRARLLAVHGDVHAGLVPDDVAPKAGLHAEFGMRAPFVFAGGDGLGGGRDGQVAEPCQSLGDEARVVSRQRQPGKDPVVGRITLADLDVDQHLTLQESGTTDGSPATESSGSAKAGEAHAAGEDGVVEERIEVEN